MGDVFVHQHLASTHKKSDLTGGLFKSCHVDLLTDIMDDSLALITQVIGTLPRELCLTDLVIEVGRLLSEIVNRGNGLADFLIQRLPLDGERAISLVQAISQSSCFRQ